ncbi:DUF6807 family protein [Microbacterium excoecariae]|uniref:DUF6807 family protein n=1 Tax=Microbacterium excoecariae TaxID=2715210 RepID=UPI00140BC39F|nr:DUF6807 family protein [Microbacterium excoecariae]NHI17402.1 oxidoreductase [Microbacterium excoecariae]
MTELALADGTVVARSHRGSALAATLSPRPYLTAETRAGVPVTETRPADHPHHLGVSVAIADVDGTSFWGGRTFVPGRGSTMLDNHGRQHVVSESHGPGALDQTLAWTDPAGRTLLTEARRISALSLGAAWALTWETRLTAVGEARTFGSPQTNGRDGAFYGGIFWRAPFADARVRTADGEGVGAAHGSRSPHLVLEHGDVALVAVTRSGMPWFVRAEGYVGFGPAVAVSGRRRLALGDELSLDLTVAVCRPSDVDGVLAHTAGMTPEAVR